MEPTSPSNFIDRIDRPVPDSRVFADRKWKVTSQSNQTVFRTYFLKRLNSASFFLHKLFLPIDYQPTLCLYNLHA
jgi:hypothetical protein